MWVFASVPGLKVGKGALATLGGEVRPLGNKAVVLCGRHLANNGTAAHIVNILNQADIETTLVLGPSGEPTIAEAAAALHSAKQAGCTVVVAVGGGSVLDEAKAVAGLYHAPGNPHEVITNALYNGIDDSLEPLPWIAVPTTAGTGSEVTHVCVLSDPQRLVKQSMRSNAWYARTVVIDPELYASAPPHVTAAAGMDALTQAIEAHTSRGANALTQSLSRQATALLAHNLVPAYLEGSNLVAREATALGSCMAGIALGNARLGAVHGLAHPIGIRYRLAHGLACAILLPYVMRFNMVTAQQGYAELAVAAGVTEAGMHSGEALLAFVEHTNEQLGIPRKLGPLGVQAEHISTLAKEALTSGSTKANPRSVEQSDLEQLLQAAL